jgi:large subunit ribosomal protein L19
MAQTEEKSKAPTKEQTEAEPKEKKAETDQTALVKQGQPYPEVQPGCIVRVHEKITDVTTKGQEKQRVQVFEGMVLQRKHGKGVNATITVRKVSNGVGVEKIFPLSSPIITKIEIARKYKVRRANLGYLRNYYKRLTEIKAS